MIDLKELRMRQQKDREIEHKARLARQKKRKTVVTFAVIATLCLIPLFSNLGEVVDDKIRLMIKKRGESFSTWNLPENRINIDSTFRQEDDKKLQEEKSDIKGLTKYQKIQLGLEVQDGSDSDGDGLTDKDEIEKYGTNPLKCSTSGDLYSDAYKIQNGMNPTEKYDYDGDPTIRNENGSITLYAKTPFDLGNVEANTDLQLRPKSKGAKVFDHTETAKNELEDQASFHIHYCSEDEFYKAYVITGYDGDKIRIDLDMIAREVGERPEALDVEIYAKQADKKIDIDRKKNVVIADIDGDAIEGSPFNAYEIYVTKPDTDPMFNTVASDDAAFGVKNEKKDKKTQFNDNHALIVVSPFLTAFLNVRPKVYCSEDITEAEKELILTQATKVYRSLFFEPVWVERPICDESYITYTTSSNIQGTRSLFKAVLSKDSILRPDGNADPYKDKIMLIEYQTFSDFYDSIEQEVEDYVKKKEERKNTKSFTAMDEFNFNNFNSPYTGSGVCMGMARVTAEVFNDNTVSHPRGQMTNPKLFDSKILAGSTLNYDITQYPGCATFNDRYLDDYQTTLSQFDKEDAAVMQMLTWYWADGNEKISENPDSRNGWIDPNRGRYISWDTVEKAKYFLNRNQILIATMFINNNPEKAHAVNIVGYTNIDTDQAIIGKYGLNIEEAVRFMIYDSNFNQNIGYLTCYKYNGGQGNSIVLYEYDAPRTGGEKQEDYTSQYMGFETDYFNNEDEHAMYFMIATEEMKILNVPFTAQ